MNWENEIKNTNTKNFILDIHNENKIMIYQNKKINVQSITKSFTSLAIGFLIDDNLIRNIADPIYRYLPNRFENNWMLNNKKYVTIKHLLTHTGGIVGSEFWFSSEKEEFNKSKDIFEYILGIPLKKVGKYKYSNIGVQILSCIVTHLTNMTMEQYLKIKLFKKLKIDKKEYSFKTYNKKYSDGFSGLFITIQALYKVSKCIFNLGVFNDKQIIPKHWINQIFKPKFKEFYSYLFYVNKKDKHLQMIGDYGNFVNISLKRKIIMIRLYDPDKKTQKKYWSYFYKQTESKKKYEYISNIEAHILQKAYINIT
jgi:CubicO group peptidase (beta-lactamase class C family)